MVSGGEYSVDNPIEGVPRAKRTDWLPDGEPTVWRYNMPAADLKELGAVMLTDDDVMDLCDKFEIRGRVNVQDFLRFARRDVAEEEDLVLLADKLRRQIRKLARKKSWKLEKVFKKFDANGDGTLSRKELKRALDAMGFSDQNDVTGVEVRGLMEYLDTDRDNKISFEEFEKFQEDGYDKKR